jgi:hypothetical protein
MKKLALVLPIVLLAACDRPTSDVRLDCHTAYKNAPTIVHVKTYKDRAELDINGIKATLDKVTSDNDNFLEFADENFAGTMPDTQESVELWIRVEIEQDAISNYSLSFGQGGYGCNVLVPVKHDYPKPTAVEKCIDYIENTVYLDEKSESKLAIAQPVNKHFADGRVRFYEEYKAIPATDAIKISPNWDPANPKYYSNGSDRVLEEHEKDACETVERLKQYMAENNLSEKLTHIYEEGAKK